MFPKVGDIVQLNHDFLKVWFNSGNRYFGDEVWEEKFIIKEVRYLKDDEFRIDFYSKNYDYYLNILSNGESNLSRLFKEYKSIQIFYFL